MRNKMRMRSPKKLDALLALSLANVIAGCVVRENNAETKGHYENYAENDLMARKGKQIFYPEYKPAGAVLLSDDLIVRYELEDLLAAIADTSIEKVMLTTSPDVQLPTNEYLKGLENFTGRSFVGKIGENMAKISLFKRSSHNSDGTAWIRDYAPLTAIDDQGKPILVDFNYMDIRPSEDVVPETLSQTIGIPRMSLPIYLEGGNFMINDQGDCLMTDRVVKKNAEKLQPGDRIFTREEIEKFFIDYGGCKKVVMFPTMPHEATGHIDIWAKFLSDDKVMVSVMSTETLATVKSASLAGIAKDVKEYLDARRDELKNLGYTIIEVPMPAPDSGEALIFRSYTNSLLVNESAIVPIYRQNRTPNLPVESYVDDALIPQYEQLVKQAYEQAGFKFRPVLSDKLIQKAGAVHCTTMQLGKATSR